MKQLKNNIIVTNEKMVQQALNKLVNGSVERFKKPEMTREKVAQGLKIETRKYQNSIYNQKYIKKETLVAW